MGDAVITPIRDLTPLVVAGIGLVGVVATWLAARRRNRVDKLRETWANWSASALEATDKRAGVLEHDASIREDLRRKEAGQFPGFAHQFEHRIAEILAPGRSAASEAAWRLRRDHHLLELLEDDERSLGTATSVTNAVLARDADQKLLNGVRVTVVRLALDNRLRFLRPWRRWRKRSTRPAPLRDPSVAALEERGWAETVATPPLPPNKGSSDE
jgi:hypothetical protein